MLKIGSLFSGAGGLDLAVEAVFGGATVWHCEINRAASRVLAHRWPDVPNLSDITAVDWARTEPVDVLCGGFPCQDVSSAGHRAGIKAGTRSGLWAMFAEAIDILRPRIVVVENVRGLLNAEAHRNVEWRDPIVGEGPGGPVLRAAGAVCGDLADLGYDAQWTTLAASAIGAPHRRERVFIVATDTDGRGGRDRHDGSVGQGCLSADTAGQWWLLEHRDDVCPRIQSGTATDATDTERQGLRGEADDARGRESDAAGCAVRVQSGRHRAPETGTDDADAAASDAADTGGQRHGRGQDDRLVGRMDVEGAPWRLTGDRDPTLATADADDVDLFPTPTARDFVGHGPADMNRHSPNLSAMPSLLPTPIVMDHRQARPLRGLTGADYAGLNDVVAALQLSTDHFSAQHDVSIDWGKYAPVVRRWEQRVGRSAPPPTQLSAKGNPRLNPAFSEWMMGWPSGWCTDVYISRNDQLRIIGNGVCPQQAHSAITHLLTFCEVVA